MAVQFKGSKGSPVAITLAVSSKTGGAVKATFVWQNITDPTSPTVIEDDEIPVPSSSTTVSAADLNAAPMNIYSMLVSLVPTDDAIIWAWAIQNDVPLAAVDGFGNPLQGQGPHSAVQAGAATNGQSAHIPASIKLS